MVTTRTLGEAGEDRALAWLQAAGLVLLERNYRSPGRGGGEIDLIMRTPDGTCVFVEVRLDAAAPRGLSAEELDGLVASLRPLLAAVGREL